MLGPKKKKIILIFSEVASRNLPYYDKSISSEMDMKGMKQGAIA
jgi:hypothetical protein